MEPIRRRPVWIEPDRAAIVAYVTRGAVLTRCRSAEREPLVVDVDGAPRGVCRRSRSASSSTTTSRPPAGSSRDRRSRSPSAVRARATRPRPRSSARACADRGARRHAQRLHRRLRRTRACGARLASTPAIAAGGDPGPARRRPVRGQEPLRRRGLRHARRRRRCCATSRRRHSDADASRAREHGRRARRHDEHGRVRVRLRHRKRARRARRTIRTIPHASRAARPAVPAAAVGGGDGPAGPRLRHQRLDPRPGGAVRHLRHPADVRPLSRRGAYPFCASIDTVGPFAGTAADLDARVRALAGAAHVPPAECARHDRALRGWAATSTVACMPRRARAVDRVCAALGVDADGRVPGSARAREAAFIITAAEAGELHAATLAQRARPTTIRRRAIG